MADQEPDFHQWSCSEVIEWLEKKNFGSYIINKFKNHKIDGFVLSLMSEKDLRDPPMSIELLGDIKRLTVGIGKLQEKKGANLMYSSSNFHAFRPFIQRLPRVDRELSTASEQDYPVTAEHSSPCSTTPSNEQLNGKFCCNPRPEFLKLVISAVYCYSVFLVTAFSMAVVHDRVPDMKKYPPLPDIVLDNMPHIPWAFNMCELTGIVLCSIISVVLVFHKHRFIILRRIFSLAGTIFLLRAFTMLITSLSVPGHHLQCQPQPYGDVWAKLSRAWLISKGFGMSLQGVRTCGDYMFSGHTVAVTLLNFFILEYSPRRFHFLHTTTWVLNIFGIFFILAAHEHYSIDVFIAYYITSRLFMYYHTLANNKALLQPDSKRTRIWFPLFSYFESNIDGMIPNQFGWPLRLPTWLSNGEKQD